MGIPIYEPSLIFQILPSAKTLPTCFISHREVTRRSFSTPHNAQHHHAHKKVEFYTPFPHQVDVALT